MTRQEMADTSVTLDGKPAQVCGTRLEHAVVRSADAHEEFAWATVEHVIKNVGGAFRS
jgi:hypothetical protein